MKSDEIVDQIVAMFERATPEERKAMDAHLARIYNERVATWLHNPDVTHESVKVGMGTIYMTEDEAREASKPLGLKL